MSNESTKVHYGYIIVLCCCLIMGVSVTALCGIVGLLLLVSGGIGLYALSIRNKIKA